MRTFKKAGIICAVCLIVATGCKNSTADHPASTDRNHQEADSSVINGTWEKYEDSVLVARGSYKNGKKTGNWTYWYPNGQIREEGHFRKGEKDGMWVQWYKDGEVMWKGVWDMGERKIDPHDAEPEIEFPAAKPEGSVLNSDSTYLIQIRIPNVPPDFLFVEVSTGKITRTGTPDQFVFHPSGDGLVTLLIGYYPDKDFKDFRNLVAEREFTIVH